VTRLAALVVVLLAAPSGLAADPPAGGGLAYTPPVPPGPPDVTGLILRLFGLTALMLALCGGVVWLVRRSRQVRVAKTGDAGRLRHEGSLALGHRCAIHLIQADGQAVAVTTDATGLQSLVVLSEPFETALAEAGAQGAPGQA
jgi:flagellar biogenesis protein FliO